ncbi:hypothetical protein IEQ34_014434 [Dendrobium chrysotoxum]|uniref:Uncharacterized protein n=1 Tax=Dendrobium chrysotoxum TaxID=161865 RepID=A0AAV7GLZ2_DENCH|nr:hypothetical protein IEQ34_014434 [Dendrobium chrysotoxum]
MIRGECRDNLSLHYVHCIIQAINISSIHSTVLLVDSMNMHIEDQFVMIIKTLSHCVHKRCIRFNFQIF